jgi:hypothetical protein
MKSERTLTAYLVEAFVFTFCCCNVNSYDQLLEKAKVPSLKVRRMRTMAIESFKNLNKLSPSCLHDLVVFKDCKYNFRHSNIVDIRTSTMVRILLTFRDGTLPFSNNSSYVLS